ncbi:unnamed protein product [Durusdinium trenchii]|uniref:Uncharacterized protein n=2 Tax=Durusdinium trenchii TaxID=1381693 RepID=A0ABP0M366_9DINO
MTSNTDFIRDAVMRRLVVAPPSDFYSPQNSQRAADDSGRIVATQRAAGSNDQTPLERVRPALSPSCGISAPPATIEQLESEFPEPKRADNEEPAKQTASEPVPSDSVDPNAAAVPKSGQDDSQMSLLYESDIEERPAVLPTAKVALMKRPAAAKSSAAKSTTKTLKRPAAATEAAGDSVAERIPSNGKRPASFFKKEERPEELQPAEGTLFPAADRSFTDADGQWQVFEFERKSGDLQGKVWRKIVHRETGTVYPSYAKAALAGFDINKIQFE